MDDQNVAYYIFNILVELMIKADQTQNVDVAIETVNVLAELCESFYGYLDQYHNTIFTNILKLLGLSKESQRLFSSILNFFQTMAQQ